MSLDGPSTSKRIKLPENKMANEKDTKIVNDIVHGLIEFPDYIRLIIDTEQFQRLRHISQLGFCQFVYPSASYSRFEHSIGTFHLASLLMKQLKRQAETCELDIEYESGVKSVEIKKNGESFVKINKDKLINKENNASEKFTKEDKLSVEVIRDFRISIENTKYLKINRNKILVFTDNEMNGNDFDYIEINKNGSNILKMSAYIMIKEKCLMFEGNSEAETLKIKINDEEEVQIPIDKKLIFTDERTFKITVDSEIEKNFESIEIRKSNINNDPIFKMTNDFKVDEEGIKYIKHADNKELEVTIVKHVEDLKSVQVKNKNEQIVKVTKESVGNYFGQDKTIAKNDKLHVKMTKEEIITEKDVKCVEIAALCHDLGHGPFSHFWEHTFPTKESHKSHEELSVEIFKNLIKNQSRRRGKSIKDDIGLDREMVDRIERIILGKYNKERDSNKRFLFEIVANKESGLDVDKFDYLCRDSIYLGWANKNKIHDIKRIMYFLRIAKEKDKNIDEWRLAVRDREIFHIYDIFYYRHLLHRYGYQHKTVKAMECIIKRALESLTDQHKLVLIENVIGERELKKQKSKLFGSENIALDKDKYAIIFHSKAFISKVCNYHIWDFISKKNNEKDKKKDTEEDTGNEEEKDKEIEKKKSDFEIILQNIQKRNLCKLYCKLILNKKMPEKQVSALETLLTSRLIDKLNIVYVSSSNFSLSSEKGNPITRIPFYEKETPTKWFMFNDTNNPPPSLLKNTNEEYSLLIFTNIKIKGHSEKEGLEKVIDNLCEKHEISKIENVQSLLEDILKENCNGNEDRKIKRNIEELNKKMKEWDENKFDSYKRDLKNIIAIVRIVEEMCTTEQEETLGALKKDLNEISGDTFDELKEIIKKINNTNEKDGLERIKNELKEMKHVKCDEFRDEIKKKYTFERLKY